MKFVVSKAQLKAAGGHVERALVYVDPQKLECAFAGTPLYIGPFGANPRGEEALRDSRARVLAALEFINTGQRLLVSCATLDGMPPRSLRFIDGKHRFLAYRDLGLRCIPLLVPCGQRKLFQRLFKPPRGGKRTTRRRTLRAQPANAVFDTNFMSWGRPHSRHQASGASIVHRDAVDADSTANDILEGESGEDESSAEEHSNSNELDFDASPEAVIERSQESWLDVSLALSLTDDDEPNDDVDCNL